MTKLSALRAASEIRAEDLADDQVNAEHIRTASARAVAMRVLAYRMEHGLSQRRWPENWGCSSPRLRLEAGDHEPTFTTLERLARGLGIEFHIDITPAASRL